MRDDPKTPEAGTPENLGLTKPDTPDTHGDDAEKVEEKGEPFDGNFA